MSCITCGGMDPKKLKKHPITFSKSYQLGNTIRTVSLPIEVYTCDDCQNHKQLKKLYKLEYDFFSNFMKFDFKSPIFTKIFKDHNPQAYVKIDARNYLPEDYDAQVFQADQVGRERSKDESKELMKLAKSKDHDTKVKVALQEDLPEELLRKFIARDNPKGGRVQLEIAKNKQYLSSEVLRILSEKKFYDVRLAVANRKNLPMKAINTLAMDPFSDIREIIYNNYMKYVQINVGH